MPGKRDESDLFAQLSWTRRLATELVADAGLAEDLVQDAWVQFMKRPPRPTGSQRAWFAQVMRRLALQRWRREQRYDGDVDPVERKDSGDAGEPTQELVARADAQRVLVEAVLELEQPTRDVVLLRYWEGLESPEIARRLGMTPSTVRTRLQRGLARLRERLEARHGAGARDWLAGVLPLLQRPAEVSSASLPSGLIAGWALALAAGVALLVALVAASSDRSSRPRRAALPGEGLAATTLAAPSPSSATGGPATARRLAPAATELDALETGDVAEAAPAPVIELETVVEVRSDARVPAVGTVYLSAQETWIDVDAPPEVGRAPLDLGGTARFRGVELAGGAVGFELAPGVPIVQRSFRRTSLSDPVVLRVGDARIEGRVWTAEGAPAADVEVMLGMRIGNNYGALRARCNSDALGRFEFAALPGTGFWLWADVAAGGGEVRVHGTLEPGELRLVDVGNPAGRVRWSGRLVNALGMPVRRDGRLEFQQLDDAASEARFPVTLTPERGFSVWLVPGSYDVVYLPDGSGWHHDVASGLVVSADAERDLVLPGVRVHGAATSAKTGAQFDPEQEGSADLVLASDDGNARRVAGVGRDGTFAFEGTEPGRWTLTGDRLVGPPPIVVINEGDREFRVDVVIRAVIQ